MLIDTTHTHLACLFVHQAFMDIDQLIGKVPRELSLIFPPYHSPIIYLVLTETASRGN